jgi:hypothetical protein
MVDTSPQDSKSGSKSGAWKPIDLLFVLGIALFFSLAFAWAYSAEKGSSGVFDHFFALFPVQMDAKALKWIFSTGGILGGAGLIAFRHWLFDESLPGSALVLTLALTVAMTFGLVWGLHSGDPGLSAAFGMPAQFNLEIDDNADNASGTAEYWVEGPEPAPGLNQQPLQAGQGARHYLVNETLLNSGLIILHYIGHYVKEPEYVSNVQHEFTIQGKYSLDPHLAGKNSAISIKCQRDHLDEPGTCQAVACENITFDGCPATTGILSHPLSIFPSETVAYAASNSDSGRRPGWLVPSLKTLAGMADNVRPGYTKFDFSFKPGSAVSGADRYYVSLSADGKNIFTDGIFPEEMTYALRPNEWNDFTFGLENLDFTGNNDGIETIAMTVTFVRNGQKIASETVTRPYIALRDAPEVDGHSQNFDSKWSGNYMPSDVADRYEIFTGSSVDEASNKAWRDGFNPRKLPIVLKPGMTVRAVMRLRPPWPEKHNPNYGTALGYQLPTEQIKFTFSAADSTPLCSWAESNLKVPKNQLGVYDQKTRAEVSCDDWLKR